MEITTSQRPPAEIYDEKFVPAVFGPWGAVMTRIAALAPGEAVLDVACGTGAATVAAKAAVGPDGRTVGIDANPEMLAVARRKPDPIEWVESPAEALPFADAAFDAVISQFGLMFFTDRPGALREMMRVLKPGGRLAVAVCGAVERSPGYSALAKLLDRLFGTATGDAFRAPFVLGDPAEMRAIGERAGLVDFAVTEHSCEVRFASIEDLVATESACVWTLGGLLDKAQFARLLGKAQTALAPFVGADGEVVFDMPAVILAARKA